jgi:hypothetical protein
VLRFDETRADLIDRWPRLYPPDFEVRGGGQHALVEVKWRGTIYRNAYRLGLKPEMAVALEPAKLFAYVMWERYMKCPCYVIVVKEYPGLPRQIAWGWSWNLSYLVFRHPERICELRERANMPDQQQRVVMADFERDLDSLDLFPLPIEL